MLHIILPVPKAPPPQKKIIMRFHLIWAAPSLKKSGISIINIWKAKINNCHSIKRDHLRVTNNNGYQSVLPVLNYSVIASFKRSTLPN